MKIVILISIQHSCDRTPIWWLLCCSSQGCFKFLTFTFLISTLLTEPFCGEHPTNSYHLWRFPIHLMIYICTLEEAIICKLEKHFWLNNRLVPSIYIPCNSSYLDLEQDLITLLLFILMAIHRFSLHINH